VIVQYRGHCHADDEQDQKVDKTHADHVRPLGRLFDNSDAGLCSETIPQTAQDRTRELPGTIILISPQ
jgi:hypothetical protein